jgi:hypothetical protein
MPSPQHPFAVSPPQRSGRDHLGPAGAHDLAWSSADLAALLAPLSAADDALSRLDERLRVSPVRAGWIARTDFTEACATLWAEGALVHLEDLVLHDAGMDIRSPSHELVRAHQVLRLRRKGFSDDPKPVLSPAGILALIGRNGTGRDGPEHIGERGGRFDREEGDETLLGDDFEDLDPGFDSAPDEAESATLASAAAATKTATDLLRRLAPSPAPKDSFIYDEDWNEAGRLADWCDSVAEAERWPPLLAALGLALAWQTHEPLQRQAWLAPVLAGLYLRRRGRTKAHLLSFNLGLRALRPKPGGARTRLERLQFSLKAVEAAAREGLAQHDRLGLARQLLDRKCKGRRGSSRLPQCAELLLEKPLVTVPLIAQELRISQQGAQGLVAELGSSLREITGRRRYRAWTIG